MGLGCRYQQETEQLLWLGPDSRPRLIRSKGTTQKIDRSGKHCSLDPKWSYRCSQPKSRSWRAIPVRDREQRAFRTVPSTRGSLRICWSVGLPTRRGDPYNCFDLIPRTRRGSLWWFSNWHIEDKDTIRRHAPLIKAQTEFSYVR